MEVNPAQSLLMKVQREPVEISQHGKRVIVVISPEEYNPLTQLKRQNLKAVLAESIAQADRGELYSVDNVFAP